MRNVDRALSFHPLTMVPEGEDVMVGRADIDSYGVFPASGAALLDKLRDGMSPETACAWYERTYAEKVDIADFLDTLADLGFLRESHDLAPDHSGTPVPLRRLGAALFSAPAFACYLVLAAVCGWLLVTLPEVRPHAATIFFSNSLVLVQLVFFVGGSLAIYIHESFHVLAGRRLGLRSKLGIGRRLYFVVFETTLIGLNGVPKNKRYLPFLAGMVADVIIFSLLTIFAALTVRGGVVPWYGSLALSLAYMTMIRFTWQFYFFLRTDLYYIITAALGCFDLHAASSALLHNLYRRATGRGQTIDLTQWSAADRKHARWYAVIMVIGFVSMTVVFVLALAPVLVLLVRRVVTGLVSGVIGFTFWDTVAAILIALFPTMFAGFIYLRERMKTANLHVPSSSNGVQ